MHSSIRPSFQLVLHIFSDAIAPSSSKQLERFRQGLLQNLCHLTEFLTCFTHGTRDSHERAHHPRGHVSADLQSAGGFGVRPGELLDRQIARPIDPYVTKREPMDSNIEKLLYSRQDAAVALSVSLRSIDYLISDGKLTTRRIGRKTLIPVTEIRRFARGDHPEGIRLDARRTSESQLTRSGS
jgi:hypothetical protein